MNDITTAKRLPLLLCLLLFTPVICFAQKPELVVQTGHNSWVYSVAFSPDGNTLATSGDDSMVLLWDVTTGTQLRSLAGHSFLVKSIAFSPDGRTLATGGFDSTVKLWNVATGKQLRSLNGYEEPILSVAFSPDGKTLATGIYNGAVKLWDVATGKQLRVLSGPTNSVGTVAFNPVAFSPDGRTLANGWDNSIRMWDVESGVARRYLDELNAKFNSVAFSPDGRTLATGGRDKTVRLWDAATGTQLRVLSGHTNSVDSVAFSPDGRTLATGGNDSTVKLWDVATGKQLRVLIVSLWGVSVAFSPDGKTLAIGGVNKTCGLWDVATGTQLRALEGRTNVINSVAFSPNGRTLGIGGVRDIRLWDMTTSTQLRLPVSNYWDRPVVAFSPNGRMLASGGSDGIKLWEMTTSAQLRALRGSGYQVDSVAFSPDGRTLATDGLEGTVDLWDVATGTQLRSLNGHSDLVRSIVFSPDGRTLATGGRDKTVRLWDVATGTQLRSLEGNSSGHNSVAFSPDGRTLATDGNDFKTVKLWDVATGKQVRLLEGYSSTSVAFSPDGRTLATSSSLGAVDLWDVATGTKQHSLEGHTAWVTSISFSPDGRMLASGSRDGKAKLWDVKSGQELASLIPLEGEDWIVATPDGLFDGSPAAWNQLLWRFNNNTFDYAQVEAFYNEFYYPGLLTDIFAGKRPKAPTDISQKDRRQPQLKLTLADAQPNTTLTARAIRVKIDVSQAPAGAQDVRLFRNSSLVKVWHGDVLRGRNSATLETTLPVVAGENKLSAYAFNHDNIKSSDVTLVVNGAEELRRAGTLYIVAVGVGQYTNADYNLNYTSADAQAFGNEMRIQQALLQQAGVSQYEQVKVITLLDHDATKANILRSLRRLSGADTGELPEGVSPTLAELRVSQPEDAVLIYFSGHGTAQGDRFYLIPNDMGYTGSRRQVSATGLQTILARSISDMELEQEVQRIDAKQLLLVIDACNSGQALQADDWRRGPMNTKGLAQLAYEKGMYVLTASQSVELAFESDALKHSYLTYALVEEGLKSRVNEADSNNDGQLWLREWFDYAVRRVPQMRGEKIAQTVRQHSKSFELIENADRGKVQTPRVFYRREPDTQPWVIARAKSQVK